MAAIVGKLPAKDRVKCISAKLTMLLSLITVQQLKEIEYMAGVGIYIYIYMEGYMEIEKVRGE